MGRIIFNLFVFFAFGIARFDTKDAFENVYIFFFGLFSMRSGFVQAIITFGLYLQDDPHKLQIKIDKLYISKGSKQSHTDE